MKRIVLALLATIPLAVVAQQAFTIKGKFSAVTKATIYLYYEKQQENMADSVKTTDGSFSFKGSVAQPEKAMLVVKLAEQASINGIDFYLEPGNISIKGPDVKKAVIRGGKIQEDLNMLWKQTAHLKTGMEALVEQNKTATEKKDTVAVRLIMNQATRINNERKKIEEEFVRAHPASPLSWDLLKQHSTIIDPVVFEPLYLGMDAKFRETEEGKQMAERLASSKITAVGKAALDFEQQDVNGVVLKLSSLKGKYVLLDFWASWCGPCRAENPNVLKAYQKFKDRQFEILAVSLDNNKERWLAAIQQDGMPWIHVSDLKGWKNEVAVQYDIRSIPQNLLIGPDGVIIAKNLRGEALEEKLNEILK